ncbi:phosphoadenosine phosphosulfate reductase [Roseovarius sp. A21]|uniref:Phosphoadenosine phosphosulfate reductase n=1 Tax=Roseovarius bejariae TaxID=2576383 RepID=A0A844CL28_9RHOB|nr:phosphoadenosine phosphosulfate reductase [Roseovarius bejariae]MRU14175.1 phosphoadenosine phosphosulfate reductase [Roseovarius bejariae]
MQDNPNIFEMSFSGLTWDAWIDKVDDHIVENGFVEYLGARHFAAFIENKPTLLVTFESLDQVQALSANGQPMGWSLAKALGWSSMALVSDGDTWFRDPRVFGFFDRLIDDGFFEKFEQILFYGAGAAGYAAAAFSVTAPGARVLCIQPQATLDPRVAEWDNRFLQMRRTDFDTRYGYAPDMLDAADKAFVLYDPDNRLDAMHASLFTRPNVTKFRMRHLGPDMEQSLMGMSLLLRIIAQMSAGKLDRLHLAKLFRARRRYVPYLKRVMLRLERDERLYLNALWAHQVMRNTPGPRFRKSLRFAYDKAEAHGIPMPEREFA